MALPSIAAVICGLLRGTGGVLGCTAMAGVISIGAVPAADAAVHGEPEPRRSMPLICRHATNTGDRHTMQKCRRTWLAMQERSRRRSEPDGEYSHRGDRHGRTHKPWRRYQPPKQFEELFRRRFKVRDTPRHAPVQPQARASRTPSLKPPPALAPEPTRAISPEPPRTRSPEPPRTRSPEPPRAGKPEPSLPSFPWPTRTRGQADDLDTAPPPLQPVLILGLLLPAMAAICYPFRHRLYAAAGLPPFSTTGAAEPPPPQPRFSYRPALDPFAVPAIGLTGPGAVAAARILALTALDEHGKNSLVVIPRPDTASLFGLAEDELLDDDTAALFIPGNLDAALAYLETELAIREKTGVTDARRLLLVADPEEETERIEALLDRHPGGVSAILLGDWTGGRAAVDDDGMVEASPAPAVPLPERLPAMSRTEARDRLFSALAHHRKNQKSPSRRRHTSRRS